MEVHFGGGFARLVEGGSFSVLYVSGVGVEDAARAIPGLRVVRVGGGVVVTHNGRPVVPVVGGSVESCLELASRVFRGGAWRRARLLVGAGRLAAVGAIVTGVASLFVPLAFLMGGAVVLAAGSLVLLALSSVALRGLARQVAYGAAGEVAGEAVGEEGRVVGEGDYYVEAARLCCEKARRLVAEGREGEAMEYALRALNYASRVVRVEVEASSPLQVVEAVAAALRGPRRPRVAEGEAVAVTPEAPTGTGAESSEASGGEDVESILEVVEAYAKRGGGTDEKGKDARQEIKSRSGRLEEYM